MRGEAAAAEKNENKAREKNENTIEKKTFVRRFCFFSLLEKKRSLSEKEKKWRAVIRIDCS